MAGEVTIDCSMTIRRGEVVVTTSWGGEEVEGWVEWEGG